MASPSRYMMKRDVIEAGFRQGEKTLTECQCADCHKTVNGLRSWWTKVSYEYNEWEGYCLNCAYELVHRWDGFNEEMSAALMFGQLLFKHFLELEELCYGEGTATVNGIIGGRKKEQHK